MATWLLMYVSSFIVVFLLGLQSRNVVAGRYLAAVMTSACINCAQFAFVKFASHGGALTLFVTTLGGCTGIAFAIWFYKHVMTPTRAPQALPGISAPPKVRTADYNEDVIRVRTWQHPHIELQSA